MRVRVRVRGRGLGEAWHREAAPASRRGPGVEGPVQGEYVARVVMGETLMRADSATRSCGLYETSQAESTGCWGAGRCA